MGFLLEREPPRRASWFFQVAVDSWTFKSFRGCENELEFRNSETKPKLSLELKIVMELIFLASFGSSVVFPAWSFHQVGRIKPGRSVSIVFKFILSSFFLMLDSPAMY